MNYIYTPIRIFLSLSLARYLAILFKPITSFLHGFIARIEILVRKFSARKVDFKNYYGGLSISKKSVIFRPVKEKEKEKRIFIYMIIIVTFTSK